MPFGPVERRATGVAGDLLGTGTVSSSGADEMGSILEKTKRGATPLTLPNGETRTFIEDGDTLTLTGWAQADDHRVGFGECTGKILPAVAHPAD